ncbi:uncharacterized protein LOC111270367 isoform X3 [Varroa jacobsoni]|nr:uncharacterized protein LOC111244382 isoform X3 [Varroa destructor]XP_022706283.1 uncharacterized protein LOC111270367 isoform X3 [Varroa jacobsoni]
MFAAYVLATSSGWQAGGSGWTDGPSFSWKQGTQQTPVILNDRSGTSWINPEVPSAVASGGPSDWQTATSITRINTPVGYAAPAPSAGGGGWKTPIISHASPATYSGSWQGPSAPIKVAAVPQQSSSGYSAAWIAPAAPQPIPVAITYGGGGRVWQAPAPASASWTSVPAVTKGAGLVLGAGAGSSQGGRWVREDGRWVWETQEVRGEFQAVPLLTTHGWQWPEAVTEEIRVQGTPTQIAPTGHAVSWSWSRRGRDVNCRK